MTDYDDMLDLLLLLEDCFVLRDDRYWHKAQDGWVEVSEDLNDYLAELADLLERLRP